MNTNNSNNMNTNNNKNNIMNYNKNKNMNKHKNQNKNNNMNQNKNNNMNKESTSRFARSLMGRAKRARGTELQGSSTTFQFYFAVRATAHIINCFSGFVAVRTLNLVQRVRGLGPPGPKLRDIHSYSRKSVSTQGSLLGSGLKP